MKYRYCTAVRDHDALRKSFNKLTGKTFGFDFENWYRSGGWGAFYVPHVLLDGERVISNVSVNWIKFDICGVKKTYLQLGTVMTDEAYRGQGLNRRIMERVLEEYSSKVDGMYLFANDTVRRYYPKFGFRASKEYEYYIPRGLMGDLSPYEIEKVDMAHEERRQKLYEAILKGMDRPNPNDGMYMSENLGLYQFWLSAGFGNGVFYLPEKDAYAAVSLEKGFLRIYQIFGEQEVEIGRLANSFGEPVDEVVLGYTPAHRESFLIREHLEEDCNLFILGEDLKRMEKDKMKFPILSHA